MKKFLTWKILAIVIVTLVLGFFDLPGETQSKLIPNLPESITNTKVNLGLDLQGGSQLDYKIDLRKVPESEQEEIVSGVLEVIERRVNGLGVAEPNIYTANIAGETHIIVELAETAALSQTDVDQYLGKEKNVEDLTDDEKKIVSLEKAKAVVGKTILLEFKEEAEELSESQLAGITEQAANAIEKIKDGADFGVVGQEEQLASPGKVVFDKSEYIFASDLNSELLPVLENLEPGEYHQQLVELGGTFIIDGSSGQAIEDTSLAIVRLSDVSEGIRNEKEVDVSHIIIQYVGLDSADASITRTEEEAKTAIEEVQQRLIAGEDFSELAEEFSDDLATKGDGGTLSAPVVGDGSYDFDFEEAALAFESNGELSEIVKTQFGYHILKADDVRIDVTETQYQYESIEFSTVPDPWKDTGLTGKNFVNASVQFDNSFQPFVQIQFDDEGADLFEELTTNNVGKRIAIFVGGNLVSSPRVNTPIIPGDIAQIIGQFTNEEAQALARDLNTGAIPAPIVLTGEYTIGASLGQEALSKSITAGVIGLVVVMLFMIAYYGLPGLVADIALLIYAVIFMFLIKSQIHFGWALFLAILIFAAMVVKILNNKDSGWEKFVSLVLSCFALFFLTFLLRTGVVMTLAGTAGIILSIGMAVDANILIFERFKEELRSGKSFGAAVETGFDRAWSAIRDSNFSTLITCGILFYFGSSIIRGFAFNLAAGILVSMFTAITVTRTLLAGFIGRKIAKNMRAFGVNPKRKGVSTIKFIKNSKIWLSISGVLVTIAVISTAVFGLNLGIDFKGGTLMELQFEEPITKEELASAFDVVQSELEPTLGGDEVSDAPEEGAIVNVPEVAELDLTSADIFESGENNFIIKTKYLTSEIHDQVLAALADKVPSFTEQRFTTIGPVIGQTLLSKAIFAVVIALLVIIIYVAIAFRKVPKSVSPWRFGATAIVALVHDVLIVLGLFAILGHLFDAEINALFITAMLTVFGYSVNDTIVIFDRFRENLIKHKNQDLATTADLSLNQTLARSINTSLSTIITLLAVLLFGSQSIFFFVLALTAGAFIGTYSSIFVAGPILVWWQNRAAQKQ